MFSVKSLIARYRIKRSIELIDDQGCFYPGYDIRSEIDSSSKIELSGRWFFGFFQEPGKTLISHKPFTTIYLGKNSRLIIKGDLFIRPGTSINVGENATLIFEGDNTIGSDCFILCNNKMVFGRYAELSWNVTAIDEDFHRFQKSRLEKIDKPLREMNFGKNCGVMSNVLIPKGISIGENSVVGGGVVLRQNLPPDVSVYESPELKVRNGVHRPI